MAPPLSGVHHVSICVDDVDAARRFYVDVMGFRERDDRPDFGFPGAWLDAGGQQLHLLQAPFVENGGHYAIRVDDLDAWCAHLDEHGVRYGRSPHFPGAGQQAFLRDPAGNQIELNQPDH